MPGMNLECIFRWSAHLGQTRALAWGKVTRSMSGFMKRGHRIVKAYGNHPSFLLMAYGNEPDGNICEYLSKWVTYWKQKEPRRLHTSGAGWPLLPENDFLSTPTPRIQAWGDGNTSRINARPPETCTDYQELIAQYDQPVVSHEIGQWCAYPNFEEIEKYTGYLKAKNFEIFRDFLANNHMGDQAHDFLMASGKLQVLCYKEEIESALRTPGFGGFQLLGLQDFPGQGTALVGVLDAVLGVERICDSRRISTFLQQHGFTGENEQALLENQRIFFR